MATRKRKYKVVSCHTNKTAAKKKKTSMQKGGKTARLVKKDGKWCVASAGNRKTAKRKTRRRA